MSYYSPYKSYVGAPRYSGTLGYSGLVGTTLPANRVAGQAYSEYIPIEKSYTDYVPEYKVDYRPVERRYVDY